MDQFRRRRLATRRSLPETDETDDQPAAGLHRRCPTPLAIPAPPYSRKIAPARPSNERPVKACFPLCIYFGGGRRLDRPRTGFLLSVKSLGLREGRTSLIFSRPGGWAQVVRRADIWASGGSSHPGLGYFPPAAQRPRYRIPPFAGDVNAPGIGQLPTLPPWTSRP